MGRNGQFFLHEGEEERKGCGAELKELEDNRPLFDRPLLALMVFSHRF